MTVGDVGIAIVLGSGGYVMTGGTAVLIAAPGRVYPGPPIRLTPLVIAADGLTAVYTTTGKDFLIGGWWQFQLEVTSGSGQVYTSSPSLVYISPQL